ncbi:hypothetical protein CDV36_002185 [Fusarium kuroshium]|uniref:Uncharacterized protein n=1 Tax=Fusarium kuroshium TaxID=2010991 RepID=A0A3M2SKX8_9HYPO|nr:hypothetical protein CDV36_002185 [Fusarium kuroshium]
MGKDKNQSSTSRGKKRGRSKVKDDPERPPPALRSNPQVGKERKFVITRQDAMRRAGSLENRLGDDTYNQMELATGMKRWLSKPVIMVLSESMKKKVFDWCQQYDTSWLGVLFEAKGNTLTTYEYTAEEEHPILPENLFQALRALVMELPSDRDAYKRLWAFVQLVTTHSQRIFLMEELEENRPEFAYKLDGQGIVGTFF